MSMSEPTTSRRMAARPRWRATGPAPTQPSRRSGYEGRAPFDVGVFKAQASGFLGWQHVFGGTVPRIDLAFAGGDPFGIAGVPIAEDAAIVNLGLDV